MYINHDDLTAMASGPSGQGEHMLKAMDREIVSLKRQVQNNKQVLSSLKRKTSEGIDSWRPPDTNNRINARWTNDELLLAVQGMRKYGKDFSAIAEVIGTKTEAHLRTFFVNYRRRYNLDAVLVEYEAEHGPIVDPTTSSPTTTDKMDVDGVASTSGQDASPGGTAVVLATATSSPTPASAGASTGSSPPASLPPPSVAIATTATASVASSASASATASVGVAAGAKTAVLSTK